MDKMRLQRKKHQYKSKIVIIGGILFCGYILSILMRHVHFKINTRAQTYLNELYRDVPKKRLNADIETIEKMIEFMTYNRSQYDQEVVDFVKKLLIEPSPRNKLNIRNKTRKHFSESDQSEYIDNLLNGKRDGFFIEAGALDGESYSNSLFFERERKWTGLLIEPIPRYFNQLKDKKRHAYALNACIARNQPTISDFQDNHTLSGKFLKL